MAGGLRQHEGEPAPVPVRAPTRGEACRGFGSVRVVIFLLIFLPWSPGAWSGAIDKAARGVKMNSLRVALALLASGSGPVGRG
jgi:hypothetical protein